MAFLLRLGPLKVFICHLDIRFSRHMIVSLGELDSHTLLFEAHYNWTGLLIEPMVGVPLTSIDII